MEQVIYTDWDQECELLKEWLADYIDNHIESIKRLERFNDFWKMGMLLKERYSGPRYSNLNFDQWKAQKLYEDNPREFCNRYFIPSYMPEMTEEEFNNCQGMTVIKARRLRTNSAREPWPLPYPIPTNIIFKH